MARFIRRNGSVLDIATGTGDVIISLIKQKPIRMAVGIDVAQNMLLNAQHKRVNIKKNTTGIFFIRANAMSLPFIDESFDVVTIAFGIRNMTDPVLVLEEVYRVLKKNGKIVILEFSLPNNVIIQKIYLLYLRYILPALGAAISGDRYAYRYLNKTIEIFPYGKDFLAILKNVGFKKTQLYPQTLGTCTIYVGERIGSYKS